MNEYNDVKLERIYEKQLTVFGKPLGVKLLILISLSGLILGFFAYILISAIVFAFVSFFFFCLLILSILLNKKTFFYLGEYCLEVSPSGDIYVTKLFGQCTICLGELKIIKNSKGTFIQCQEDKSHIWDTCKKA